MNSTVRSRAHDRRKARSKNTLDALTYWLSSCTQGTVVDDFVLLDMDGLCLASTAGNGEEIAAVCSSISQRVQNYEGTIDFSTSPRHLRLRKFRTEAGPLVLAGLGGTGGEARAKRIERSITGVERILFE